MRFNITDSFQCDSCQQKFKYKVNLREHIKLIHKHEKCEFCEKVIATSDLKDHTKNCHKNENNITKDKDGEIDSEVLVKTNNDLEKEIQEENFRKNDDNFTKKNSSPHHIMDIPDEPLFSSDEEVEDKQTADEKNIENKKIHENRENDSTKNSSMDILDKPLFSSEEKEEVEDKQIQDDKIEDLSKEMVKNNNSLDIFNCEICGKSISIDDLNEHTNNCHKNPQNTSKNASENSNSTIEKIFGFTDEQVANLEKLFSVKKHIDSNEIEQLNNQQFGINYYYPENEVQKWFKNKRKSYVCDFDETLIVEPPVKIETSASKYSSVDSKKESNFANVTSEVKNVTNNVTNVTCEMPNVTNNVTNDPNIVTNQEKDTSVITESKHSDAPNQNVHEGEKAFNNTKDIDTTLQLENVHKGLKELSCKHCDKKYYAQLALISHLKSVHNVYQDLQPVKKVNKGSKEFFLKQQRRQSFPRHCKHCGINVPQWSYNEHIKKCLKNKNTDNEDKKSKTCDVDKEIISEIGTETTTGIKNQEGQRNYKCDHCGKSFTHSGYLESHINMVHEGQKDYNCESCSKSFSQAGSLKRHIYNCESVKHKWQMAVHEELKSKTCEKESNTSNIGLIRVIKEANITNFEPPVNIPNNENVHEVSLVKKVLCKFCNEMIVESNFNQHINANHYSNIKNQEILPKAKTSEENPVSEIMALFNQRLIESKPVHEGKKAVSCIYCRKVYSTSQNLTLHVKSEHYKFSCKNCDKSFATQHFLNVHANR